MNETNETETLCYQAEQIMTTILYVILTIQCIFGPLAVFLNILVLYLLWGVRIFHSNLRLLLANLSLDLALFSGALVIKSFHFFVTPICDLLVHLRSCAMKDWILSAPLHNSLISLTALCFERLYATLKYSTYDQGNGTPYLAITLLAMAWLATWFIQIWNYFLASDQLWIPICSPSMFGAASAGTPVTFIILELLSCASTIFVYGYNKLILSKMVINRAKFNLASRFQVSQNLKLSKALLPSDLLHVISYLPSYSSLVFALFHFSFSTPSRMWFLHLTYLYRTVYACAHPLLLMKRNPNISGALKKTMMWNWVYKYWVGRFNTSGKTVDVQMSAVNRMNAHFDYLEKCWDEGHEQKMKGC